MTLFFAILLVIAVVAFVVGVQSRHLPPPEPLSPTAHLEERKARIYDNLRDLQFEYRLGKLSDADYQSTKLGLQSELAAVLAEVDSINKTAPPPERPAPAPLPSPPAAAPSNQCPACGAKFDRPLKFCGECGKPMIEVHQA